MVTTSTLYRLATTPIFGIATGEGTPVVCLHGITANAYVFEPIIALLADSFRVISIDQRGHGRSGRPEDYAAEDFADDIAALVHHLRLEPVFLLGHSLGARNALVAANRHPDLVRGVVAVDFTPFIEPAVLDALECRVNDGDRVFADRKEIFSYLSRRYPHTPADAITRRTIHGYGEVEGGYRPLADSRAMSITVQGLRANLEDAVKNIKQRALLVRGAKSKLVSPAAWTKTCRLRPDLEAVEVADADHYVPEAQPAAVAALVRRLAGGQGAVT